MNEQHGDVHRLNITTQTGVSIGAIVIFIAGVVWIMNGIGSLRSDIILLKTDITLTQTQNATSKAELLTKIEGVQTKVTTMEASKNGVTAIQFFQWAVHLQQSNPQLKVPEPEVNAK